MLNVVGSGLPLGLQIIYLITSESITQINLINL